MLPCESAAFRRMPAFLIAAVRPGPCGIARASSSATCASASKSSSGRLFLAMVKKLVSGRHLVCPFLDTAGGRHGGDPSNPRLVGGSPSYLGVNLFAFASA